MRKIITLFLMVAGALAVSVTPLWAQVTNTPTWTMTNTCTPTNTHTTTPTNTPTITYTPTNTFTPTSTFTRTFTSTITPTITATTCSTIVFWAETSSAPGSVTLNGTLFQKYVLSQAAQINILYTVLASYSAGTSLRMGIYNNGGTYPSNLIYATLPQAANTSFFISADKVYLAPGTYWLASDLVSGSAMVTMGGGVTPAMTSLTGAHLPNPFPAASTPPIDSTTRGYLGAYISTCNFGATPTPRSTDTPVNTPMATSTFTHTSTFTITPSVTACATNAIWGETTTGPESVTFSGTYFQKYVLAQSAQINGFLTQLISVSAGTSIRMGIYSSGVTYPSNLVYVTSPQVAYPGTNVFYIGSANLNLAAGTYWLALTTDTGSAAVTGGGGVTPALTFLNGQYMPNPFPSASMPPVANNFSICLSANINTCNPQVSSTPLPTNTPGPTDTPTTTPTPSGPVTFIYINSEGACATAFGCSIAFVHACRQLNLDITTLYIMMRIGATCGCQPSDIMQLRLTMGWDEICAKYGLDWAIFAPDLQTRIDTLQPEIDTPNQLIRGAANDPSQFPINNPGSMPDTLTTGTTFQEVCPLCQ